jgi:hypothetical protein
MVGMVGNAMKPSCYHTGTLYEFTPHAMITRRVTSWSCASHQLDQVVAKQCVNPDNRINHQHKV